MSPIAKTCNCHPRALRLLGFPCRTLVLAALLFSWHSAAGLEAFTHEATDSNTFLHATTMDHPAINGDPNAIMVVAQVYNPDGNLSGVENEDFPEVGYSDDGGRWIIFNVNESAMPTGASFNVLVAEAGDTAFVHEASEGTFNTVIDHPSLNDDSNAQFLVTRHGGSGLPQVDDAIGVAYGGSRWRIGAFSGSGAQDIPVGSLFNVIVPTDPDRTFTHSVQEWNLSTDATFSYIDVPAANGSLDASVFLTHFRPDFAHASLPVPPGVLYDLFDGRWAVFRQDGNELQTDTFFFGYVAGGTPKGDEIFSDRFEEP